MQDKKYMKRTPIPYIISLTAFMLVSCTTISGVCTDKEHVDRVTVTRYRQYGHTSLPETSVKPEKWYITISKGHHTRKVKVTEERYNSVYIGDTVTIK